MTIACGMIGCPDWPDWVSILDLRPIMCEAWTTKVKTGTGDDGVTRGDDGATAANMNGESVAQTEP